MVGLAVKTCIALGNIFCKMKIIRVYSRSVIYFQVVAVAITLGTTRAKFSTQHYDISPIISGFSTCYIELALFMDSQEFQAAPEIPVSVSKTITNYAQCSTQ